MVIRKIVYLPYIKWYAMSTQTSRLDQLPFYKKKKKKNTYTILQFD